MAMTRASIGVLAAVAALTWLSLRDPGLALLAIPLLPSAAGLVLVRVQGTAMAVVLGAVLLGGLLGGLAAGLGAAGGVVGMVLALVAAGVGGIVVATVVRRAQDLPGWLDLTTLLAVTLLVPAAIALVPLVGQAAPDGVDEAISGGIDARLAVLAAPCAGSEPGSIEWALRGCSASAADAPWRERAGQALPAVLGWLVALLAVLVSAAAAGTARWLAAVRGITMAPPGPLRGYRPPAFALPLALLAAGTVALMAAGPGLPTGAHGQLAVGLIVGIGSASLLLLALGGAAQLAAGHDRRATPRVLRAVTWAVVVVAYPITLPLLALWGMVAAAMPRRG